MKQLKNILSLAALVTCVTYHVQAQVGPNKDVQNPNLAVEAELISLPHFNEKIAKELIKGRPYLSIGQFNEFLKKHLSDEQRKAVYPKLFVPLNLNNTTREEILLVPGVGPKMAHEFEEYKPYKTMAQFAREMGKYIDDAEVARLQQYVFVPINLNDATDADMLSIPGVGSRMLREFKEYRPYKNAEQFRREIGKYVDDNEVKRLERYLIFTN